MTGRTGRSPVPVIRFGICSSFHLARRFRVWYNRPHCASQGWRLIDGAHIPQIGIPWEDENMAERVTQQELEKAYDCVVIGA